MKIFLTGGTGFIGSYVVKALSDDGHDILILARNPNKVKEIRNLKGVKIIKGNLNSFNLIKKALKGFDACIHIALGWGNTAVDMIKNDTIPAVFLMEESAKLGLKLFIYTSSSAAVGYTQPESLDEESKTKPVDNYGAAKASCENFLLAISNNFNMKCNIIRPGYTFGNPVIKGAFMQPDKRFINIVTNAKSGKNIELIKYDGTQFIHAGDLAKIYQGILNSDFNRQIYFGLSKEFVTWEEIAKCAIDLTKSKSQIILKDKGYDKNPHLYKINKIERDFNLKFNCKNQIEDHLKYLINVL